MRMSRRLALTIAVACGLLAALLTYVYLRSLKAPAGPEPSAPLEVAVVTPVELIPAGTMIKAEMVEQQKVPADQRPQGAVEYVSQIVGDRAAEDLAPGEPIRMTQMASDRGGLALAIQVPLGMRAVTVALEGPVAGVAGFLQPGDRVDVLGTFEIGDIVVTRTVLQNIQLLAYGEETSVKTKRAAAEGGEGEPKPAVQTNATLAVTPEDAQKLVASDARGKIRLLLRRRGEEEGYRPLAPIDLVSVVGPQFFVAEEKPEEPPPAQAAPAQPPGAPPVTIEPPRPTVEIIRGTQREIVTP